MRSIIFTSESVTEGHPDKLADQISDAIVDDLIRQDRNSRVAVETLVTNGLALVAGEITTDGYADIPKIVRSTIRDAGYDNASFGFDYKACAVLTSIHEQSPDIALGTNSKLGKKLGAGDQGMMFGFACRETAELMPLPIMLAHGLTRKLAEVRKKKILEYLRPDGKSQVSVEYDSSGKPKRIAAVVVSTQHSEKVKLSLLKKDILKKIIKPVLGKYFDTQTEVLINPTGRFVRGGPPADTGMTGRKIIVDTYGGYARHGGGAFSGKDPTKVDRSAAYAARWVAKNIVAADFAERVEVQLAYAIGHPQPIAINLETFGSEKIPLAKIEKAVRKVFDLSPAGILRELNLVRPIFLKTASYGHFGRKEFEWEKTNRVAKLQKAV
ncbi:methionine adenosyltransferase [Candidatus Gracilibacteria bacterium]|nr:methionine adenosyltransferase [Candidatus Gracilibacteria bacterium]